MSTRRDPAPRSQPIYTIGHSVHPIGTFISLLRTHAISQLADVRTIPRSKRHPHFGREELDASLTAAGITYRHFAELGGLRKPRPDSVNTGWRHPSFRGYADYMQTPDFSAGVDALLDFAVGGLTVVMCAESVWWQCHRRLLADALIVRGVPVRHILSTADPKPHELSEFARPNDGGVIYPGLL